MLTSCDGPIAHDPLSELTVDGYEPAVAIQGFLASKDGHTNPGYLQHKWHPVTIFVI